MLASVTSTRYFLLYGDVVKREEGAYQLTQHPTNSELKGFTLYKHTTYSISNTTVND